MRRASTQLAPNGPLISIYKSLKYGLILMAFCEGMLLSHHMTFFFLYTKYFKLDLLTYTIFESVLSILFCLNPLFGYISDHYSFLGSKKKSYLILVGMVSTLGYAYCGMTQYFNATIAVIFVVNFLVDVANSFQTVLIDSLCVILHNIYKFGIKTDNQPSSTSTVTLLFISRLSGKVISTVVFGIFYSHLNTHCWLIRLFHSLGHDFHRVNCRVLFTRADSSTLINQRIS
jgi:hypothetical protein